MSTLLLGLHRPGTTLLHRLPAGAKLLLLMMLSIVVAVVRGPVSAGVAVVVSIGLLVWAGADPRATVRSLRGLLVVLLVLGFFQVWQSGWAIAAERVGDLLAMVLLATVVTTTTAVDDTVDVLVGALHPLRPLGVNPEAVALAFSLMLRAIPAIAEIAEEARQAAVARGLERSPRARLIPLVIRVVAQARMTGEALQARGLADD